MKAIINSNLFYENKFQKNLVIIFDDVIKSIISIDDFEKLNFNSLNVIDAKGDFVVPGFIDVHIHGYDGFDTMDGTTEAIDVIRKGITANGVTSFLPTTMTMEQPKIEKAIKNVERASTFKIGANILGVHLEGPYINSKYKGAQDSSYIVEPDFDFLNRYKNIIKVATIAPEINNALPIIEKFHKDFNFSIGHSNATYEVALDAFNKGCTGITHLFNAMTPLNHRSPGIVGCALTHDFYTELIADNIHVSEDLYDFLITNKGFDKLILVTDCIQATNMPNGIYSLGGQNVTVNNGRCTLDSGTIAGSTLKLNTALKNFTTATKHPLEKTINLVTSNPAKYLGVYDTIGSLDVGKKADIVIMDENFNIKNTIVEGDMTYEI